MIGREAEKMKLLESFNSDNSEFVAVYGRRRVGKTYLIRETFNNLFVFQHAGLANASMADQLSAWVDDIREAGLDVNKTPRNWLDAFSLLKEIVKTSNARKKVVFIDELPWMDTPRSKFLMALEHFWNGWASARKDVLLVVCGSATSWIVNNIFKNHGGLHNRVTRRIQLLPFTLHECELYAESNRLDFSRYQLLVGYMIMGGIPYYWSQLQRGMSLDQNIDELFFSDNGSLRHEFNDLYASLFRNPESYIEVVATLGSKSEGMTREDLLLANNRLSDNGMLTQILQNLEYSGFIRAYKGYGKKVRNTVFQLTDHYSIFYFKFLKRYNENDPAFWTHSIGKPLYNTWCGLAFERVCLAHIPQIKRALGIEGIASNIYSWRSRDNHNDTQKAQIDLLVDRADQVINVCEIKFSSQEYKLGKEEMTKLRNRKALFCEETKTRKAVHLTMITTYGLAHNAYWGEIQKEITADDLMKE